MEIERRPIAREAAGTIEAAVRTRFNRIEVDVESPTGQPVRAGYARRADTAIT